MSDYISIEEWLYRIEPDLGKYEEDFRKLDFKNTKSLRFLRQRDLDKFSLKVSSVHKRMILHAVEKLQSPDSKRITEEFRSPGFIDKCSALDEGTPTGKFPRKKDSGFENGVSAKRAKTQLFKYQTPMELALAEMDEKIIVLETEVDSAKEYQTELIKKFCFGDSNNKTILQCGKCHMREGHSKRSCANELCLSAQSCGDVDKHPEEKKQLSDAGDAVKSKARELEKCKEDKELRLKSASSIKQTFANQMFSHVVNSNIEKYTFKAIDGGHTVRRALVNQDLCILEKHYHSKIPKNLKEAALDFQNIIDKEDNKFKTLLQKPEKNPVRKLLENEEKYPIKFPAVKVKTEGESLNTNVKSDDTAVEIQSPRTPAEEAEQTNIAIQNSLISTTPAHHTSNKDYKQYTSFPFLPLNSGTFQYSSNLLPQLYRPGIPVNTLQCVNPNTTCTITTPPPHFSQAALPQLYLNPSAYGNPQTSAFGFSPDSNNGQFK